MLDFNFVIFDLVPPHMSSPTHASFLARHPLLQAHMPELVVAAYVCGFPRGGDPEGRQAYGRRWEHELGPKNLKAIKSALGALGLSKGATRRSFGGGSRTRRSRTLCPRRSASPRSTTKRSIPKKIPQISDIVKLYLHKRKPGRPPMLCMAVMYRAMLETYKVNPLKLYADKIGALDAEGQRLHDEKQNAIRESQIRKERRRRKRPPARRCARDADSARAKAERLAKAQAEAKERARLAAIRRAEQLERSALPSWPERSGCASRGR